MSISTELRSKRSRDNRELLDRAADNIDELTALYENLLDDVKHHATRDICDICKYHDQNPDCCADWRSAVASAFAESAEVSINGLGAAPGLMKDRAAVRREEVNGETN